ncbi:MAG: hypothetical protein QW711_07805, partial [Candidatus Korarchaeum sp.]
TGSLEIEALAKALSETFKVQSLIMASAMVFSISRLPKVSFRTPGRVIPQRSLREGLNELGRMTMP